MATKPNTSRHLNQQSGNTLALCEFRYHLRDRLGELLSMLAKHHDAAALPFFSLPLKAALGNLQILTAPFLGRFNVDEVRPAARLDLTTLSVITHALHLLSSLLHSSSDRQRIFLLSQLTELFRQLAGEHNAVVNGGEGLAGGRVAASNSAW